MDIEQASADTAVRLDLFEDRYGTGSHARVIALLRQPCVTFAEIAHRFGVTRECVRQWHQRLLPDAPSGHARQRLCRLSQRKHQLLADQLFKAFYHRVRADRAGGRVALVPARDGFRKRTVRVDGHVILLKKARTFPTGSRARTEPAYTLTNSSSPADFIYFELTESDYLFVPRSILADRATTFVDTERSKYHRFKNTFAALPGSVEEAQAS
jgi:hypothetical protein